MNAIERNRIERERERIRLGEWNDCVCAVFSISKEWELELGEQKRTTYIHWMWVCASIYNLKMVLVVESRQQNFKLFSNAYLLANPIYNRIHYTTVTHTHSYTISFSMFSFFSHYNCTKMKIMQILSTSTGLKLTNQIEHWTNSVIFAMA